jgi:hypothetical protein
MPETRRAFVWSVTAAAGLLAAPRMLLAQKSIKPPPQPEPAQKSPLDANPNTPGARAAKRAQLQKNAEEFRQGVEQLYQLAGELREEVQRTATIDVLSIPMYKKAEQIEKLAKQLKSKAKGG